MSTLVRGTVGSQLYVWNAATLSWVAWDGNSLATGGVTTGRIIWPNNTVGQTVKGTAGQLYGWYLSNTANTPRFVKLYDKATAPTIGVDTPTHTIMIPAQQTANLGVAANLLGGRGIAFLTGIGVGVTCAVADGDTTAPLANEVVMNLFYV